MDSRQVAFSEITPSEFFYRNRDLAGFGNPARALYSAVRELVENSLDACDLFGILPEMRAALWAEDGDRPEPKPYTLRVADNGPGIDPKHVPDAFGRVFFGSKFRLRQARGMFGLGGTMAVLYGQITTNSSVTVETSVDGRSRHRFDIMIDIQGNRPIVLGRQVESRPGPTGTAIQFTLEGDYTRAGPKIQEYFRQTALVTPYASLTYIDPDGLLRMYERATSVTPRPPRETLPHPYGIDVEVLRRLVRDSKETLLLKFMCKNFHRVGDRIATRFLQKAGFDPQGNPKNLSNADMVRLTEAMHRYPDFLQPDAGYLSPLGEEILKTGLEKELMPEFVAICQRPPSAYSGFPFIVEVGLAYGGPQQAPGIKLYRFANRIPLLYDEASDVAWKIISQEIDWKRYRVGPDAPIALVTHLCSTRVPYKTVGKEYIADRPEIEREIKNAIREVLRSLSAYLTKKGSMEMVKRRLNIYAKYIPMIARFSSELAQAKRPPKYKKLVGAVGESLVGQQSLEEYDD